jgi:hypothetical protein
MDTEALIENATHGCNLLWELLSEVLPEGRGKSLVKTKLDEVRLWAREAIEVEANASA